MESPFLATAGSLAGVGPSYPTGNDPRLVLSVKNAQVGGVEGTRGEELGVGPWSVLLVTKQEHTSVERQLQRRSATVKVVLSGQKQKFGPLFTTINKP